MRDPYMHDFEGFHCQWHLFYADQEEDLATKFQTAARENALKANTSTMYCLVSYHLLQKNLRRSNMCHR